MANYLKKKKSLNFLIALFSAHENFFSVHLSICLSGCRSFPAWVSLSGLTWVTGLMKISFLPSHTQKCCYWRPFLSGSGVLWGIGWCRKLPADGMEFQSGHEVTPLLHSVRRYVEFLHWEPRFGKREGLGGIGYEVRLPQWSCRRGWFYKRSFRSLDRKTACAQRQSVSLCRLNCTSFPRWHPSAVTPQTRSAPAPRLRGEHTLAT